MEQCVQARLFILSTLPPQCFGDRDREWGHRLYLKNYNLLFELDQFSSVAQSCPTLCDPMNRSMPGLPVQHQLSEPTQTHVH